MNRKFIFILGHVVFWVAYAAFLFFIFFARMPDEIAWKRTIFLAALHIPVAYFNMEVLVPYLYLRKKYLLYLLACIAILILLFFVFKNFWYPEIDEVMRKTWKPRQDGTPRAGGFFRYRGIIDSFLGVSIVLLSSVVKLSQVANQKEKETEQLKSENLNSELKFLKSQINPHFLFNTLNNIYSLSILKSDKTPGTILKLSDMLRYVLYECGNKEKVPISKEVVYIENYVALQLLKDSTISQVNFSHNIEQDVDVAPMLFIPFVENAFKHSKIGSIHDGWIKISLHATTQLITFHIENSVPVLPSTMDKTSGIGIENVKKRLAFMYKDSHQLEITSLAGAYQVTLQIKPG